MVGRSEYSSLDETNVHEANGTSESGEEAIARYEAKQRKSLFASHSRRNPEDQEIVEQKRRGFFDVFNRNSDQDEFAPDPFAEPAAPEVKRPVRTVSASTQSEFATENRSKNKAENFGATIADVEKQATDLFDQSLGSKNHEASVPAENDMFGSKTASEQSFEDFINQQQDQARDVVEKVKDNVKATVAEAGKSAAAVGTKFDSFLNGTTPQPQKQELTSDDSSSDLFPGLSEAFGDAFDDSAVETSGDTEVAAATNNTSPFDDTINDPFVETSRKHGFSNGKPEDPWAAFNRAKSSANPVVTNEESSSGVSSGFNWTPADNTNNADSSFAAMDDHAVRGPGTQPDFDDSFLQVSSTHSMNTQPVELSDSTPLVIPGTVSSDSSFPDEPHHESQMQQTVQHEPFGSDPFLTSVPEFDETLNQSDTEVVDVAAVPATATASGGLLQWSRRTWFLLIGCIIVGLLLFMPDRHNRTNA